MPNSSPTLLTDSIAPKREHPGVPRFSKNIKSTDPQTRKYFSAFSAFSIFSACHAFQPSLPAS